MTKKGIGRDRRPLPFSGSSESREKIPPSPRLSACRTSQAYLIAMTMVSDQKNRLSTPSTVDGSRGIPWWAESDSLMAYRGLVPMSPKTTPRASMVRASFAAVPEGPWAAWGSVVDGSSAMGGRSRGWYLFP